MLFEMRMTQRRLIKAMVFFMFLTLSIGTNAETKIESVNAFTLGEPKKQKKRKNLAYLSKNIKNLNAEDFSQNRKNIINIHEHVFNERQTLNLLKVMDEMGITKTCLVSSSKYTFTLNIKHGFEEYKDNNSTLLKIKKKYPNRFCVFVTVDPLEKGNLDLIKGYMEQGANGLKLYLGHGGKTGSGPFHSMLLDDDRMLPIYKFLEEEQIPLIMHVNLTKYYDEFVRVMDLFPKLKVNIPHFGLHKNTAARLKRLGHLFDKYPNLYSDISFGWYLYHISGFEALAKWRTRSKNYIKKYADRFMFATDMVLDPTKDNDYIRNTIRSYMQLLETKHFRFFYEPDYPMHGLHLDGGTLDKVYKTTATRFLSLKEE